MKRMEEIVYMKGMQIDTDDKLKLIDMYPMSYVFCQQNINQ
jgi:hypothetical protein